MEPRAGKCWFAEAINDVGGGFFCFRYGETPVPDHTFEPGIPDADTHLFTFADLQLNRHQVAFSYACQRFESRTKNNLIGDSPWTESEDLANGLYKSELRLLAVDSPIAFNLFIKLQLANTDIVIKL